jgi:hypothetical protein
VNHVVAPRRIRRTATAVAALIAVAVLVLTGYGGSPSSTGSGGSPGAGGSAGVPSAVAYSACLRTHRVPNYPDPDSTGELPKPDARHLGVSSSQLRAAEQACQHLLPNSGGAINVDSVQQCMEASDCPRALIQQVLDQERSFAGCMRSHGVPNWPDPSIDSQGRPVFAISVSKLGFDPYSPQVWAKGNECSHLMPALPGLPAAVSP